MRSAYFVDAIITDSKVAGFKNYDNIKPGHTNVYVNGGENHPYCEPYGIINESLCRHYIPIHLLTYLNNNFDNSACLVTRVCPETITADTLSYFNEKDPTAQLKVIA